MFGIDDVTTPIFIITCIPINVVIPVANRLPNISGDFIAIKIPLHINIANNKITITHPTNPNSSAIIENIKDICEKIYASQMQKYRAENIIERLVELKTKENQVFNKKPYKSYKFGYGEMKYPFIEYMSYKLKKTD